MSRLVQERFPSSTLFSVKLKKYCVNFVKLLCPRIDRSGAYIYTKCIYMWMCVCVWVCVCQSVENAGVTFVKVANERNEFFEKINRQ